MLKNTLLNRIFIRGSILLLRAIAPSSILYCCARLAGLYTTRRILLGALDVCATCESFFYLAVYLPRKWTFNRSSQVVSPLLSRSQRRELFIKSWEATSDAKLYLSKWFYMAPVERLCCEDVKDFISWRLWNRIERNMDDEDELDEYLAYTQDVLGWHFAPGRSGVKSMMVTFEPLQTMHRPLFWYLVNNVLIDDRVLATNVH